MSLSRNIIDSPLFMSGTSTRSAVFTWIAFALVLLPGCVQNTADPLFVKRAPAQTGVEFANIVEDDTTFNMLTYLYYYDGGGVAAGDVNGDGLPDLYFTANLLPNRLYLNRGGLTFEDVTETAGVAGEADWSTGVTMADVNGDGHLDIYVSTASFLDKKGHNELFINNGDGSFTERSAEYGLDHVGYSTQATFFDFDADGDLDVYLLNHSTHIEDSFGLADTLRYTRHATAGDKLFRNEGFRFTDVSEEAGILGSQLGYGLGIVASDLDMDGCIDLFVSNDFHENDYLYYNNCDGTFEERITRSMGHTSRASMGNDAADFNNDGLPDIIVLDMMPDDASVVNSAFSTEEQEVYNVQRRFGYHHQLMRNTLQLNRGERKFSEIAFLAGMHATDWSWAPLFADLDNDGLKDLFISNGIYRRPNDRDFVRAISSRANQAILERGLTRDDMGLIELMPPAPGVNYAFRNRGDLTFENVSSIWGLDDEGFSNGAIYADLDNDGDLDLVLNNLNAVASIYENRSDRLPGRHSVTISLQGDGGNTAGFGTKVFVYLSGYMQLLEVSPSRGFQSSVDPRIHVGLGTTRLIDSLVVVWPDRKSQTLTDVSVDTMLTLRQVDASGTFDYSRSLKDRLFEDITDRITIGYRHEENVFVDFNRQRLIPHLISTEGPALAVGDVNGDGLEDLFAGGGKHQPAQLLLQREGSVFESTQQHLWLADSLHEDVDAEFFDADSDGDLDLYVVSGGNEFWGAHPALRDRLYINHGGGRFVREDDRLPEFFANGCCVAPADYDSDGDLDLFVGSRVVSRAYGETPTSYLFENDGSGHFSDVTDVIAEGLSGIGMVTDASWSDIDGDGFLDLVVVGEWMPITVFRWNGSQLVSTSGRDGLSGSEGWWNTIETVDLDGDGDMDLVAGNLGGNSLIQAPENDPVRMLIKDVDGNGETEQLITFQRNGGRYPLATVDELMQQVPLLGRKYTSYADVGEGRLQDIFTEGALEGGTHRQANMLYSIVAENQGNGVFRIRLLPNAAQIAPVFAILSGDFDTDGNTDLLLGGNFYGLKPLRGRYDASYGTLLHRVVSSDSLRWRSNELGPILSGQIRKLLPIRMADGTSAIVAARNDLPLQFLKILRAPNLTKEPH